jgi:plasmid stabilization system protein ParE
MRAKWTDHAKEQRRQIADYIRREFGLKRKKKFMQEVDHVVRLLMQSPGIGPIESLFADRPKAYRSVIINGLNKLVYYVENDAIYIEAIWDTRQEPEEQATQVK